METILNKNTCTSYPYSILETIDSNSKMLTKSDKKNKTKISGEGG